MEVGMVKRIDIDEEMQQAYLDYAMSVIVARALPDARDGLKPVHRRILYAMHDMGLRPDSPFKKSARIVGEVLGKYHPHGDMAVYEAMARMAQDFSMRYLLVEGQGNFGSVDGDPPAAMRYTEARLAQLSQHMLADIQKNTVDFASNFDDTLQEPTVLPAAVPNLLVNGATGIAVGMATSIPPHNLGEVVNALKYMLENWNRLDDLSLDELMQFIQGPDFPTGGVIIEEAGASEGLSGAYGSGRGRVTVQARAHLEEMERGRSRIIVTELPYMTNKSALIERIAELVREEKLEGISDLRDESDRQGMRIVIELTKNADPEATLRALYRHTPMQGTFSMILLALVDGEPRMLSLKQALRVYLDHRLEIVKRRSQYDLDKARARAHILEGLRVALKNLDEIIDLIRKAPDVETARTRLMKRYKLSEIQATAILDMQLRRLAALERKKIEEEYKEVQAQIKALEALLRSPAKMRAVVADELEAVKQTFGDRRRTQIIRLKDGEEKRSLLTAGDLAPDTNVWVAVTAAGRISRSQEDRPPRLADGAALQPGEQALRFLVHASTRDTLYLASTKGETAALAVASLPEADDPQRGAPIGSLSVLKKMDDLAAVFTLPPRSERPANQFLLTVTHQGMVKKSALEELPGPSAGAFTLVKVNEGDRLGWAYQTDGSADLLLVSARGAAIRFTEEEVRPMGLVAAGVMGMKLPQGDELVGVELLPQAGAGVEKGAAVFLAASDGTAKRVAVDQFPKQGRYGQGVVAWKLPKGRVAGSLLGPKDALAVVHMEQGARVIRLDAAPLTNRAARGGKVVDVKVGGEVLRLSPGGPDGAGKAGGGRRGGTPGGPGDGATGGPEGKAPSRAKKSLPTALEAPAAGSNGSSRKAAAKTAPTAGKKTAAAETATTKTAAAKTTAKTKSAAGAEKPAAKTTAEKKTVTTKAAAAKTTAKAKSAAGAEKPAAKTGTAKTAPTAEKKTAAAKTAATKTADAEKPAAKTGTAKTAAEKKPAAKTTAAKKTGAEKQTPGMNRSETYAASELPGLVSKKPAAKRSRKTE